MRLSVFLILLVFGIAHAYACSAVTISDPSESTQARAARENSYWIRKLHESSVVVEVEVLQELPRTDHTLYKLRAVRAWKSDSEQISFAYAPHAPCNQVQLTVGARFVVFAARRAIPATHGGTPLQIIAAEVLFQESLERGRDDTLAATHQQRLLAALGQATATKVRLLP
jgi:hypothetical protein